MLMRKCLLVMLILMLVILMLILMLLNLNTGYADTDADICFRIMSLCCIKNTSYPVKTCLALLEPTALLEYINITSKNPVTSTFEFDAGIKALFSIADIKAPYAFRLHQP